MNNIAHENDISQETLFSKKKLHINFFIIKYVHA